MGKAAFISRDGYSLLPCDDDGREMARAVQKAGRPVMMHYHRPRNPRHHRLLFHLLHKVIESGAWTEDEDSLLDAIKHETGLVRRVVKFNGDIITETRSISFESMDQDQFARWFDRAVYVICATLLGGHNWQSFRDEIIAAVDRRLTEGMDR